MKDRISLTMQDILEKEFKIDARGYRLQEVDKFLDVIIKDYNEQFGTSFATDTPSLVIFGAP